MSRVALAVIGGLGAMAGFGMGVLVTVAFDLQTPWIAAAAGVGAGVLTGAVVGGMASRGS